jgi:hypothetical protein
MGCLISFHYWLLPTLPAGEAGRPLPSLLSQTPTRHRLTLQELADVVRGCRSFLPASRPPYLPRPMYQDTY